MTVRTQPYNSYQNEGALPFIICIIKSQMNGEEAEMGEINFQFDGTEETAKFTAKDCDSLNNFQLVNKVSGKC